MCRRPVLATGPKGGDADIVLEQSGAGRLFDFDDMPGLTQHILDLYRRHRNAQLDNTSGEGISLYSRRSLCGQMAAVLDDITQKA
jgi:hypothetical protein